MSEEIWVDYKYYQVSNLGRARFKDGELFELKGYVYRIVWEAFNGPIPKGYEIDHIDSNRNNNVLSNLRCVSHKENMNNENTIKKFKGKKRSEAFKKRLSEARKWKLSNMSEEEKNEFSLKCTKGFKKFREENPDFKPAQKTVYQFTKDGEFVAEYPSVTEAISITGIAKTSIYHCCQGLVKSAGGFKWSYNR